jgi:hypothetical protein
MYIIEKLEVKHIEKIIPLFEKDQFQFHEYSFLNKDQLSNYFINKTIKSLCNPDTKGYVLILGTRILGALICVKDVFDSMNFGFGCYRITDLYAFSNTIIEVNIIVDKLVSTLEKELYNIEKPIYLTLSLNNNLNNVDYVFNALASKKYYYIHTLLSFFSEKKQYDTLNFYSNEQLFIRPVNLKDVDQVAELAQKSFKLSRFHLDPYLDNVKSGELLRTSAINSIKNGFVDVMFIAEKNNKVIGYYSGKKRFIKEFNKTVGESVISAVDINYRGLGIFNKLDSHLLNWFAANTDFAEMGTYLANYPVHKTWINKGLGIIRGTHQFSKFLAK